MDEQQPTTPGVGRGTRKHMGVATSDPDYLPAVPGSRPAGGRPNATLPQGGGRQARVGQRPDAGNGPVGGQPNYSRYLSTPKKGKAIFTSRQDRQRRRVKIALGLLVLAAIALALFWFFFLR